MDYNEKIDFEVDTAVLNVGREQLHFVRKIISGMKIFPVF